jgi:hypothetical protein
MTENSDYPSIKTVKRGAELIHDPLLNKGSAFSTKERDELGLHGLLPPQQNTLAQQARRAHNSLLRLTEPLDKYVGFSALQDRNEHLFYRILTDHMTEFQPRFSTRSRYLDQSQHARQHRRSVEDRRW